MIFQIGRNLYDVVAQIKNMYYFPEVWNKFATKSPLHAQSWFGKLAGAIDLEQMLIHLNELPPINVTLEEMNKIESEDKERFRAGVVEHKKETRFNKKLNV